MFKKIQKIDDAVLTLISRKHTHSLNRLMVIITNLGTNSTVWILFALPFLFIKPKRIVCYDIILAIAFATLLGEAIIKPIIKRNRPCEKVPQHKLLVRKPITYSFPSGHTTSSFAAACVLSKYFSAIYFSIPIFVLAAMIGFSRLYLNLHYLSDILAGIILGVLCASIVLYLKPLF
jgi:undecaprenyl-diphosphatase